MFHLSPGNVNRVESDEGFSVEIVGRLVLAYFEGERKLLAAVEPAVNPTGFILYARTIKAWEPPFASEPLSHEDAERILARIEEAMAFRKLPVLVS